MLYKGPPLKCGIKLNGKDLLDYDPNQVRNWICQLPENEKIFITALIENKLLDQYEELTGRPLPSDYAKEYGRPSLEELPYMRSENDGYPYLPGHNPMCDGKNYHNGMCKCKYDEWNHPGGKVDPFHTQMWPGGPCIDDFDM
jgi:hypothetical protein